MEPVWNTCRSSAIASYRYLEDTRVLQIVYTSGSQIYDFPCDIGQYEAFLRAESAGRFVERVLRPQAQSLGWSSRRAS